MINFNQLSPNLHRSAQAIGENQAIEQQKLWHQLSLNRELITDFDQLFAQISSDQWQGYHRHWQAIRNDLQNEIALTDWLIALFNDLFNNDKLDQMPTRLVRGDGEPEYFPADTHDVARIEFAHGFFQSALHEISHWCVAGRHRRTLNDFGYWYEADGRNEQTQAIFEQVEIKPQAIECLLSLALDRYFYVSQDNLNADFDTSKSTFAADVLIQATNYLNQPQHLPRDARRLLWVFLTLTHHEYFQDIH